MSDANFKVGRIVRRRDLHSTCTKSRIYGLVRDDRNLTANDRENRQASNNGLVAWVIGIDSDRGIAENGLGPGRSYTDVLCHLVFGFRFPLEWVAHVGQSSWSIDMIDL